MYRKASTAGAVVLALTAAPSAALPIRIDASEVRPASLSSDMSSTSAKAAPRLLPPASRWGKISSMVMGAVSDARAEGNPIGIAASQKAYGIAAALQAPGAPVPAIVDNELGGIAFFWKGVSREIQIEIDADNSYFVRIKQGNTVKFTEEGFGNVPIDPVNTALREWAAERRASLAVTA